MTMKEKLIAQLKRRKYNSYYFTLLAGGYLIYLAYGLVTDIVKSGGGVLMYIPVALFALAGLFICAVSAYALSKGYCSERAEPAPAEPDEEDKT